MNNENLKKGEATQFRSGEEAARNGRDGGRASGEARRKKRSRREWSRVIGLLPVDVLQDNDKISPLVKLMAAAGVGTEDQCWTAIEVSRMHLNAMMGDVSSFRALGDLDGDFKQNFGIGLEVTTPEQAAAELMERIKRK